MLPPIDSHFLGLVHGGDQQAYLDREKFDVDEFDPDISGDDDPFVEDAFEDIRERGALDRMLHDSPLGDHYGLLSQEPAQGTEVDVQVGVCQAEVFLEFFHLFRQAHEGAAETLDFLVGERPGLDASDRLAFQQFAEQLDEREDEFAQAILDVMFFEGDARGTHGSVRRHDLREVAQGLRLHFRHFVSDHVSRSL
jgi:hypothetical protein